MNFQEKVWKLTSRIPKGKVSTYKEIAHALHTRAYRAVGTALKANPFAPKVPCHRVIASNGLLGGYAGKMKSKKKIALLRREGVKVKNYKILSFRAKLFTFPKIDITKNTLPHTLPK